jgi:inner membrane protein
MDSLSQIALGAAVSVAVFRRKQPVWQSALLGALVGTLPDLDVLISHGDPISDMTYHRTESHALFYLTLISPLLAWLWLKIGRRPGLFKTSLLAVWLVLVTHPLLDMLTIYGTQLGLPFTDYPYGTGSVFVIDPLYTVPLLIGTTLVLAGRRLRWNSVGLLLSTAYLGFGLLAQQQVTALAQAQLPSQLLSQSAAAGSNAKLLVTATPFNTLLWRLLVVEEGQYFEGYYSLLDKTQTIHWQAYPRDAALWQQWQQQPAVARLHWFSHGFVTLTKQSDQALVLTDLRMGMEPGYSFRFLLPLDAQQQVRGLPEQLEMPRDDRAFSWLYQRALGNTDLSLAQYLQQSATAGR